MFQTIVQAGDVNSRLGPFVDDFEKIHYKLGSETATFAIDKDSGK